MIVSALLLSVASLGLQELPPQKLAPGQCLTMLWSKAQPPMRIAMIDDQRQMLVIRRNRRYQSFAASGPATYASDDLSIRVELTFRDGEAVTDGAIIESGVIEIIAADGEALMLPVGGLHACRND